LLFFGLCKTKGEKKKFEKKSEQTAKTKKLWIANIDDIQDM